MIPSILPKKFKKLSMDRVAFPTKSQGRQPEIGDFGAQ
jgi:hypothetical protein